MFGPINFNERRRSKLDQAGEVDTLRHENASLRSALIDSEATLQNCIKERDQQEQFKKEAWIAAEIEVGQLRSALAQAREEALEEAARHCDDRGTRWSGIDSIHDGYAAEARDCADAIRALRGVGK